MAVDDLSIAQSAKLTPITEIAAHRLGLSPEAIEPYGHYKAKLSHAALRDLGTKPQGKLILVTAISPTPAGEGKTTTSIGLSDGLNRVGKRSLVCLREPSMGPVFGMKGGAAGGGYAQVVPMEDINLHFTGDFSAIGLAHNLLAAMLDNHLHHGNQLGIDPRRVSWKRVLDVNDRALRNIVVGLGGPAHGQPRESSFDIVVASEVMAILCLSTSLQDLKRRLGNIVVAYTADQKPIRASDLKAHGAMAVLLKDAWRPNLVQTLENNPAIIHGGPFANIAHGCNSVIATSIALRLGDYVVTEAGFGADLGAEKFIDIKCRSSGLWPSCAVLVATVRALKFHGGIDLKDLSKHNPHAVRVGLNNLERHLNNITTHYGLPCVVAINHFAGDSDEELSVIADAMSAKGIRTEVSRHWAEGGEGAIRLAEAVAETAEKTSTRPCFVYSEGTSLLDKARAIAKNIYGAAEVSASSRVRSEIARLEADGYGNFPVCIAKTQYSFSTDPSLRGAPSGHTLDIREVRLASGAGFIVLVCGEVMTMPGLPRVPAAERMDLSDDGVVLGLG
jgi:formate--tetrahydrofolate ligase